MGSSSSLVFESLARLSGDGLVLRFASEADYPFVRSLVCDPSTVTAVNDTRESADFALRKLWDEGLDAADLRHFVVVSPQGACIAYFRLLYPYGRDNCLWLSYLAVAPEMRGTGHGGRVMGLLLAEARTNPHIQEFGMHTTDTNAHALHLYESLGFQCIKREPWINKDGTHGARFTLIQNVANERDRIQDEFRAVIVRALDLYQDHYAGHLKAVFVAGSTAFGEAVPGASDVDLFVFLGREPDKRDLSWSAHTAAALSGELPTGSDLHVAIHPLQRLRHDETWRYLLRYFAIQLHGGNSLLDMEREGLRIPSPSRTMATSMVGTMRRVLDETMAKGFPERLFPLPKEPWKATRKLARWFMIREGATLLMAEDRLLSFRQADVLRQLRAAFPEWAQRFELTERILSDPVGAGISPEQFMAAVTPFIRWAIDRIGSTSTGTSAVELAVCKITSKE